MAVKYPYFGYNLYAMRVKKGVTREQLLDGLTERGLTSRGGEPYSLRTLQAWECGETGVPDEVKMALCDILSCRIEALFYYHLRDSARYTEQIRARVEIADVLQHLPERIVSGLWYVLSRWDGKLQPLLEVIFAYCSCNSEKRRAEMAASLMLCYREAKRADEIDPNAMQPDEGYIWAHIEALSQKNNKKQ